MHKTLAVDFAGAVEAQRSVVSASAVSFVERETVVWKAFCEEHHLLVAAHFRRDGSKRDEFFFFISADDCFLIYKMHRRFKPAVKEYAARARFYV